MMCNISSLLGWSKHFVPEINDKYNDDEDDIAVEICFPEGLSCLESVVHQNGVFDHNDDDKKGDLELNCLVCENNHATSNVLIHQP